MTATHEELMQSDMSPEDHLATAETWLNKIDAKQGGPDSIYWDQQRAYAETAKAHAICAAVKMVRTLLKGKRGAADLIGGNSSLLGILGRVTGGR